MPRWKRVTASYQHWQIVPAACSTSRKFVSLLFCFIFQTFWLLAFSFVQTVASVCLFVCLFIFIFQTVWPFAISFFISFFQNVCLFAFLFFPSVCLSVCLSFVQLLQTVGSRVGGLGMGFTVASVGAINPRPELFVLAATASHTFRLSKWHKLCQNNF